MLASDLVACDTYDEAAQTAARIAVSTVLVIGGADRMTPPEAGMALVERTPEVEAMIVDADGAVHLSRGLQR